MKNIRIKFGTILIGCFCVAMLSACLPKAQNLNQQTYMFSVSNPGVLKDTNKVNLQVNGTSINSAFSDNQFVYRTSDLTYKKDFYNIFFIPANQQFNDILISALRHAKVVKDVEKPGSLNNVQYILKTNIESLYADYRNSDRPRANFVLQAELYYMDIEGNLHKIMQHEYQAQNLIQPQNSRGLVTAWSKDITHVLSALTSNVNASIIQHELATKEAAKAKAKNQTDQADNS